MNARKGIKTFLQVDGCCSLVQLKTMNARKGIKTVNFADGTQEDHGLLKTMNARKGIKTQARLFTCEQESLFVKNNECP